MADFSQIEQDYLNNRTSKANRDAYKIVLISRIDKDRLTVCEACGDFKRNLSPANLWQNFISSDSTSSAFMNKLINIVKVYPYISLYTGKKLLKLSQAGSKSRLTKAILVIALAKVFYNKFKKNDSEAVD